MLKKSILLLLEFSNHVYVVGGVVFWYVGDFQECGVFKEIDAANLDICYFQSGAGTEVGQQLLALVRSDEVDFFVGDNLVGLPFTEAEAFE